MINPEVILKAELESFYTFQYLRRNTMHVFFIEILINLKYSFLK